MKQLFPLAFVILLAGCATTPGTVRTMPHRAVHRVRHVAVVHHSAPAPAPSPVAVAAPASQPAPAPKLNKQRRRWLNILESHFHRKGH